MKKSYKLTLILISLALVSAFSACAKPNAAELAGKIHTDYQISLAALGDDGGLKEFGAESTAVFNIEGMSDFTEEYIVKLNFKRNLPNAYVLLKRSGRQGALTANTYEYEFYDQLMQKYTTPADGLREKDGGVTYPAIVLGEGTSKFDNFKAVHMKEAMPAETFLADNLENLTAKKKSNRTIVKATVREDSLNAFRDNYYKNISGANFNTASYTGSTKLDNFSAVSIEYALKNNRIDSKTIVITGRGLILVGEDLIQKAITVTHTVKYLYSVDMAVPDLDI